MKVQIDCPICDQIAVITEEQVELSYKEKKINIIQQFYKCQQCGHESTTTELDEDLLNRLKIEYDKKNKQ